MPLVGNSLMRRLSSFVLVGAGMLPVLAAQPTKIRDGDWPMYNRDLAGTRYSPLTQINSGNVTKLTKFWSYRLRSDEERKVLREN
jgi:glucose dehydrogenase